MANRIINTLNAEVYFFPKKVFNFLKYTVLISILKFNPFIFHIFV